MNPFFEILHSTRISNKLVDKIFGSHFSLFDSTEESSEILICNGIHFYMWMMYPLMTQLLPRNGQWTSFPAVETLMEVFYIKQLLNFHFGL